MGFLRSGDVYWTGALLLLFALLGPMSVLPSWFMLELASGEQASRGIHLEELINVDFEIEVLGGKKLQLRAKRAIPKTTNLGVFAIAGQWQGLSLQGISAELAQESVLLYATGLQINEDSLRFTGGVHLTTKSGQGILFCAELSLSLRQDFIKSDGLSILAPRASEGARGGKAVQALAGSLAEIRELAGR